MLKMENSACIEATKQQVWEALADLDKVTLWAEPIQHAHCEDKHSGVGALRICQLKANIQIRERWIAWQEGESFSYLGEGMPMIKYAKNTWSIEEVNGMILVKSEAEIVFKWGILGKLLELPMGIMMRKLGPQSLTGLKYWVETGRPFEGKFSSLPLAPINC